ncbi:uncharacterized protein [Euwallacea similis]|uniref:uncharacterized protein n=1 Tax=Euwallacea similis TaxID=1736056 RepID=UPI00344BB245
MFKSVVLILAALGAANGHLSPDSEELQHQLTMKIIREQIRSQIAIENARSKLDIICPGYGNKFENVTMEIADCAESIDEENETICSMMKNNLEKCMQPLVKLFEECLPERSRRVPAMLVKMILSSLNYVCKTNGEHLLELQNQCFRTPTIKLKRCIRKIETTRQKYIRSNRYPSAEEICDLLEEMKPCLTSHLQTSCNHPITREAFIDFMNQGILSVCENYYMNDIELVEPHIQ